MLEFLPEKIKDALSYLNLVYVYEIRLRADKPTMINYKGEYTCLGQYGIVRQVGRALTVTREEIEECVYRAGKYSMYAIEEQIKNGFITADGGIRIGLAGEYVLENGQPLTIRAFSSLCIRIAREIHGCADRIYEICMSDKIHNVLICSSPGIGKTTILRDLARQISMRYKQNILLCDERGELDVGNVGETVDVVKYCNKTIAFENVLRAMRPDVIITDELSLRDKDIIHRATDAGIRVIASGHYDTLESVSDGIAKAFDFFVFLDGQHVGRVKNIYNRQGEAVWND